MNIAIIAAGGNGERFSSEEDKLFVESMGKPVVWYAVVAFVRHEEIDGVVVVARDDRMEAIGRMIESEGWNNVKVVKGGLTRQDSVKRGVEFSVTEWDPLILLTHNAANPLVSAEEISVAIAVAKEHGAAVVGRPVVNTLKQVAETGEVEGTVPRDGLWEAQTPQAVRFELFKEALDRARNDGFVGTDDVSLLERLGRKVMIVPASEYNFKITTQRDFEFFSFLIEKYGFSSGDRPRQS